MGRLFVGASFLFLTLLLVSAQPGDIVREDELADDGTVPGLGDMVGEGQPGAMFDGDDAEVGVPQGSWEDVVVDPQWNAKLLKERSDEIAAAKKRELQEAVKLQQTVVENARLAEEQAAESAAQRADDEGEWAVDDNDEDDVIDDQDVVDDGDDGDDGVDSDVGDDGVDSDVDADADDDMTTSSTDSSDSQPLPDITTPSDCDQPTQVDDTTTFPMSPPTTPPLIPAPPPAPLPPFPTFPALPPPVEFPSDPNYVGETMGDTTVTTLVHSAEVRDVATEMSKSQFQHWTLGSGLATTTPASSTSKHHSSPIALSSTPGPDVVTDAKAQAQRILHAAFVKGAFQGEVPNREGGLGAVAAWGVMNAAGERGMGVDEGMMVSDELAARVSPSPTPSPSPVPSPLPHLREIYLPETSSTLDENLDNSYFTQALMPHASVMVEAPTSEVEPGIMVVEPLVHVDRSYTGNLPHPSTMDAASASLSDLTGMGADAAAIPSQQMNEEEAVFHMQ